MQLINRDQSILQGMLPQQKYSEMKKPFVQELNENFIKRNEEIKLKNYAMNFGSHLPMKLTIERNLLSQDYRPIGFVILQGNSRCSLGLDIHMNRLQNIEFCDFLNKENPEQKLDNHCSLFLKNF